jgi:signal transduction histidine kinase/ActR/RegA family two-component response regulator
MINPFDRFSGLRDHFSRRPKSAIFRYLLPFATIVAAMLLQFGIQQLIGKEKDFPYALFYLMAIFGTSWFGGYIPGVIGSVATIAGLPAAQAGIGSIDPSRVILVSAVSLLISWMAQSQRDARDRLRAANDELERRVQERTREIQAVVGTLESEVGEHRVTEQKLRIQLERLNLLDQITRAIGERQDLASIFQVAVRSVEEHLPVDFCCLCLYEPAENKVTVRCVGVHSSALAEELAMTDQAHIPIDQNGLSRSVRGKLVYEPDISQVDFPFPQRLAQGGLGSLVIAPLQVESQVFGVMVSARHQVNAFSSSDCEFLRQLSEHIALASNQAQVYTALQQAYDELRQSQQTVLQQERLRALGQMASGIAHDINNAISPVALYTEMMLSMDANLNPRLKSYLETTKQAIEDVAHTVSRMREFYRKQEPKALLTAVEPNRLIEQVIDFTRARWSNMAQQRGIFIDLRTELLATPPPMAGIESEIREALINLIFNAVDAMPEGGILTVRSGETSQGPDSHFVTIEVSDSGVGMDDETRRRCLEPFFTTKGERGTGLGLAMVYGVMQRHNADIEIESLPGNGTTIRLKFPVTRINSGDVAALHSATAAIRQIRILIVDDDPLIIKSLRDVLEHEGHAVTVADGGREGIRKFQESVDSGEPFSVVFTDLGMPHVDGRQVAWAVKAASPSTPVALLTGWGERLVSEGDVPSNVDRVLNKPPKLRDLRAALAELSQGIPEKKTTSLA